MKAGIAVMAVAMAVTCLANARVRAVQPSPRTGEQNLLAGARGPGTTGGPGAPEGSRVPGLYDTLLHAESPARQRAAFTAIAATPRPYLPELRQSLRDYPRLLTSDPVAARRAVTLAAYLRDIAFPGILLGALSDEAVEADCAQVCPLTLVFTVHTVFAGWHMPLDLNPGLPAVSGFLAEVDRLRTPAGHAGVVSRAAATSAPGESTASPVVAGKSDRQLLALAGSMSAAPGDRLAAALALGGSVSRGTSRRELYLLAMNPLPGELSRDYLAAVYAAIYRVEQASAPGR